MIAKILKFFGMSTDYHVTVVYFADDRLGYADSIVSCQPYMQSGDILEVKDYLKKIFEITVPVVIVSITRMKK